MSERYMISGSVKVVGEVQEFGSKGFSKREIVVTVEYGKYPNEIMVEFQKDNCVLLDGVEVGDSADVYFNIKGREYNGRYYNSLVGWKIDVAGVRAGGGASDRAKEVVDDFEKAEDDIPF